MTASIAPPDVCDGTPPLGLPRRLLRGLLLPDGFGPGSRVLDVGCGSGELVRYLDHLGLAVAGYDDRPERLVEARRARPDLDWRGESGDDASFAEREFDLVLVRGHAAFGVSLFKSAALGATAEFLASLQPGGILAFVTRVELSREGAPLGHDGSCYIKHLGVFPGECSQTIYRDGILRPALLERIGVATPPPGLVVVRMHIPDQPVARGVWLRFAETAAHTHREACCAWARSQQSLVPRRSAT